jgi:putative ATP-binding cassette transporter
VPIAAFHPYLTELLGIEWREWMTEWFVRLSLHKNSLYRIMRDRSVDNPDQRISEDINSFTTGALTYSMVTLSAFVTAATFFGILWLRSRRGSISRSSLPTAKETNAPILAGIDHRCSIALAHSPCALERSPSELAR